MNLDKYHVLFVCRSSSSFSHSFYSQLVKNSDSYIFVASDYRSFISQNLKVVGLLGENSIFSYSLVIRIEIDFCPTYITIKLYSFRSLK